MSARAALQKAKEKYYRCCEQYTLYGCDYSTVCLCWPRSQASLFILQAIKAGDKAVSMYSPCNLMTHDLQYSS